MRRLNFDKNKIIVGGITAFWLSRRDNHIRIGNRTRFTPLYSTVRRFLLSAPLLLGPTISRYFYVLGHPAAGDSHSITYA